MIYSAYGVGIDSDFALRCLPEAFNSLMPTVRLDFALTGEAESTCEYSENEFQGRRVYAHVGDDYVFDVDEVGVFRLSKDKRLISCRPAPMVQDDLFGYWLLRYILPFILAAQGPSVFFHGSAVRFATGAVAFLADSHGGKSTLANYLQQRGHTLITDDDLLVGGDEPFVVIPSIPFVRIKRKQENLGLHVERFDTHPTPLSKIYLLQLSDFPAGVSSLSKSEAAAALFHHNRFQFIEKIAERFRFCVRLASSVHVSRLTVPRDLARLEEVRRIILADLGDRHEEL